MCSKRSSFHATSWWVMNVEWWRRQRRRPDGPWPFMFMTLPTRAGSWQSWTMIQICRNTIRFSSALTNTSCSCFFSRSFHQRLWSCAAQLRGSDGRKVLKLGLPNRDSPLKKLMINNAQQNENKTHMYIHKAKQINHCNNWRVKSALWHFSCLVRPFNTKWVSMIPFKYSSIFHL